jgi:hypothetical protein
MGKSEGRRPLATPSRIWKDTINMNIREMGSGNGLDRTGSGQRHGGLL